jgi:hypothetical protein
MVRGQIEDIFGAGYGIGIIPKGHACWRHEDQPISNLAVQKFLICIRVEILGKIFIEAQGKYGFF